MRKQNWYKNYVMVCIIGFISSMGSSAIETLVSKFADYLGALPATIGMVSSAFAITALLATPVAAPLLDTFRKNRIFSISVCIIAVSGIGFSVSTTIPMVVLFRLINGIGKGLMGTSALALAGDTLPEDKLTSGIVYFTLAQAISVAVAPGIGLEMADRVGYHVTFMAMALLLICSMVLAYFVKPMPHPEKKFRISWRGIVARESLPPALILMFLAMAYSTINSFLAVYAGMISVERIGLFFTVYSLVLLISRPLIGIITKKRSAIVVLIPALGFFAVSLFLISIADKLWIFLAAAAVSAFGYGACQPLLQSLCLKCVDSERRGAGSSTSFIGTNIGYLIGPVIGGMIAQDYGYAIMYRVMIVCLAAAFGVYLLFKGKLDSV